VLWFEITDMLIAILKNKFTVLFVYIIFGTLSFNMDRRLIQQSEYSTHDYEQSIV